MSAFMADVAMYLGWVGVFCSMSAYYCVSTGRMSGDSLRYQALNITACILLAIACAATASWPSLVANVLFIMIGIRMTWRVRDRLRARIVQLIARLMRVFDREYVAAA